MTGYVYCLTNASFPGLVKIGKTRHDPKSRAAQLGSATGVPTRFDIAWSRRVSDIDAAESALHDALRHCRVNTRREFFKCEPADALKQARRLPAFRSGKSAEATILERKLGLSLAAMMVLTFLAACHFDLDAKTTVTVIAALGMLLTVISWALGLIRMVRA